MWENQDRLAKSQHAIDAELAVLLRMVISKFNYLLVRYNALVGAGLFFQDGETGKPAMLHEPALEVEGIDISTITELFAEWDEFKKRPDHAVHFQHWYMGGDLSELPPLEEAKEEDHVEAEGGDGEQGDETEEEAVAVPKVSGGDSEEDEPQDGEGGEDVPSV